MEAGEHTQYLEMFKEYFDEQTRYVEKVRSIKHDMQAHMIVLYYYLEADKSDKAKEYLKSILDQQQYCEWPVEDVGNDMVNAVICSALKRSKVPIEFKHSGLLPEELQMDDMDLCTLFSNAFSNCVDACLKLEHSKRSIFLEIGQCGSMLSIVIENPIESKVDVQLLGKGTTKEDSTAHGYGIRNMQRVVEKYKGKMDFEVTEDVFRVRISFSNVVRNKAVLDSITRKEYIDR